MNKKQKVNDTRPIRFAETIFNSGRYETIVGLIWSYGTTDDWIVAHSRLTRSWRHFSRRHPRVMEARKDSLRKEEIYEQYLTLLRWSLKPPCWRCGRASSGTLFRRYLDVSRGLIDKYPIDIAHSYCEDHYWDLQQGIEFQHMVEFRAKWATEMATVRATVVPKVTARVDAVLESIPNAPAALRPLLGKLAANILNIVGDAVNSSGAECAMKMALEFHHAWSPLPSLPLATLGVD